MEKDYLISKYDIYVGELVSTNIIFSYSSKDGRTKLGSPKREHLRSIIFYVDENYMANDLLYDSPQYPVLNITPNSEKICGFGEYIDVIRAPYNLSRLLDFYDYPEFLTYEDIWKIRNRFFNGHFTYDNHSLFGYEKMTYQEYVNYMSDDADEISSLDIMDNFKKDYYNIYPGELSRGLWHVLNVRGDKVGVFNIKLKDAFNPLKKENIKVKRRG